MASLAVNSQINVKSEAAAFIKRKSVLTEHYCFVGFIQFSIECPQG